MPFTNPIVAGTTLIREAIQSPNFVIGSEGVVSGWSIDKDGSATFYDVTIGSDQYTIDSDGDAAFNDLDVSGILSLNGTDISGVIDVLPAGLLAYGDSNLYNTNGALWATDSATINSSTYVIIAELAGGPIYAGRIYWIGFNYQLKTSTTTDVFRQNYRYTTDGSTPTATSSLINGSDRFINAASNSGGSTGVTQSAFFIPAADADQLKVALVINRNSGTGSANVLFQFATQAMQCFFIDLGDTGAALSTSSLSQRQKFTGSPDPDPVSTYKKTYSATWSRSWNDAGNAIYATNGDLKQGYISGSGTGGSLGNGISWVGFNFAAIQSALSGATVKKVEVFLYYNHWYNNAGGTAIIGTHHSTATSAPSYSSSLDSNNRKSVGGWGRNVGKWVDITSVVGSEFKTGASTGITIGPGPSNSSTYYGKANGYSQSNPPQLRITYTK